MRLNSNSHLGLGSILFGLQWVPYMGFFCFILNLQKSQFSLHLSIMVSWFYINSNMGVFSLLSSFQTIVFWEDIVVIDTLVGSPYLP